jgi:polyhydroxyalkanoate synthase
MILNQTQVEQTVDRDERARFIKELVVTHATSSSGGETPLAMVRKRSATLSASLAPVLLVHGYGQNRYAWHLPARSFSNYLARAGFDVFNLDLRGHGRSRHLGAHRPSHVTDFVREDVPAAIAEVQRHSGGRKVFLLGHSLGGLVSYATAASQGGSIAGVISLGSPYQFTRGSWSLRLLGNTMLALDRRVHLGHGAPGLKALGEAMRLGRIFIESPVFPLPIRGFWPARWSRRCSRSTCPSRWTAGSITVLRNMFLRRGRVAAQRPPSREGSPATRGASRRSIVPLLIISGTHDDLAPPDSVQPAFAQSRSSTRRTAPFPRGHIDLIMGMRRAAHHLAAHRVVAAHPRGALKARKSRAKVAILV